MAKLLVTGGAGFIGSHIVDRLIDLGHKVIVLDNLLLGKKKFVNAKAKFHKVDIRDYKKIAKYFKGVEAVFHLAADPRLPISVEDPITTHEINVTGTLNVLTAAHKAGVKKVIFSSSCAALGDQKPPVKETALPAPASPYGLHKLMGEEYCRIFSKLYSLETVCLRYFNVFGPRKLATGSYPMVIPTFLAQRVAGKKMTIIGDGKATRDYVHVSDVVEANIKAWQSPVINGVAINIGSGKQTSVNEVAAFIGGATTNVAPRLGEMQAVEADITRAKQLLGWTPKVTFSEGLKALKDEWGI